MTSTIALLVLSGLVGTTIPLVETTHLGVDLDLDAYYSAVSGYAGIGEARPDFGESSEGEIYKYLFGNIYKPHVLLFEASTYPMPLIGVGTKHQWPGFYDKWDLAKDPETETNVIQILTAGFEEPWAATFFIGNMATFKVPGSKLQGVSYAGSIFSFGMQHIKNNRLIDTNWYEFEAKLKGDDLKAARKLKWSYRVGARVFEHPQIADYWYVSTFRDRIDTEEKKFNLVQNTTLEFGVYLRPQLSLHDLFVRALLIGGKNIPLWKGKVVLSLAAGLIVVTPAKYKGCLQLPTDGLEEQCEFQKEEERQAFIDSKVKNFEFQPVVRPNLKF